MNQSGDNYTPRVSRQLAYISEYTTDIRHIRGKENAVADTLSRGIAAVTPTDTPLDYAQLALSQQDDQELHHLRQGPTALELQQLQVPGAPHRLWCDVSCGQPRPYIPPQHRQHVFQHYHSLAHPGILATHRIISKRAVWPGMRRDIKLWTRACLTCQQSKVHKHVKTPLATIPTPTRRFHTVHVDIVGPLPPSRGCRYMLTCVDRVTRWAAAMPMPDSTAECSAHQFLAGWVANFGVPHTIITDQGVQFESRAWQELLAFLGTQRQRTTAYHPQSNGMVERFHRRLKEALRAQPHPVHWVDALPVILLMLHATDKEDLHHSPAELVFGEDLRLPGQFLHAESSPTQCLSFLPALRHAMQHLDPTPPRPQPPRPTHIPTELRTAENVFLRRDAHTGPLERPYSGPYRVLDRTEKHITLNKDGRQYTASMDRIKPAHILQSPHPNPYLPQPLPSVQPPSLRPNPQPPMEACPSFSPPSQSSINPLPLPHPRSLSLPLKLPALAPIPQSPLPSPQPSPVFLPTPSLPSTPTPPSPTASSPQPPTPSPTPRALADIAPLALSPQPLQASPPLSPRTPTAPSLSPVPIPSPDEQSAFNPDGYRLKSGRVVKRPLRYQDPL